MTGPTPSLRMPPAEQEVDLERAVRLLGAYPGLAGAADSERLRLLGVGWDNTVWLVDDRWTVRFPRRAAALPLLERELVVLRALAGRLPLPVPEPTHVAGPYDDFPWPSWVAPVVPGVELSHAAPPDVERGELGAQVGAFLAVLHAQDQPAGLPRDPNRRADMAVRLPWAHETVARAVDLGLLDGPPEGFHALSAEARDLAPSEAEVLCHGDLHLRHVLVHRSQGPTARWHAAGVIDWGDACVADPALDLSFAYAALTGSARERCLQAYAEGGARPGEPLDRATEVRARVIAVGLCAMLASTAHEGGDVALRREALRGVHRALG